MLQRIKSNLLLTVKNSDGTLVDFSKASNILFSLKQQHGIYLEFPALLVEEKLLVTVPYEDAMKLTTSPTKAQLYWTDEYNHKRATTVCNISVEELIREVGYDGAMSIR